ncbi:MAG: SIS domain-containing protein [Chitinophagaceae bacterium]|nr:SIS domain-containing protein [Chitinophagaceae bacterium]
MENKTVLNLMESSHMAKEITSQPKLWVDTYNSLLSNKNQLTTFLNKIFAIDKVQIILTGAGTSAFIGQILQQAFYRNTGLTTRAIPTTDLVTHPGDFFQKSVPTLLISFARSGDSPESLATINLSEKIHNVVYHLIITCNPDGKLAKVASSKNNSFVFILPEGTNDRALAMTSSFTSMTLAGLLISDIANIEQNERNVLKLADFGKKILNEYSRELSKVADLNFKRVVFLGSGPLKGTARESHLKITELTDGQIICQYDSFLGFRHGPKAVIDESSLLIYLFSSDPYVRNYEVDLVKSIDQSEKFLYSIGIGQYLNEIRDFENSTIDLGSEAGKLQDDYFAVCSILPAQIIGFHKSIALGLTPDSPSQNGSIHRIVQGVHIYPY